LYALWVVFVCAVLVGYEVDVERHVDTEVHRSERLIFTWELRSTDERTTLPWHRSDSDEKRVRQYFLLGLGTRERAEHRTISGPNIKPPATH
jgi:hypothetical protein